jgi:predicted dehydrogenase
MGYEHYKMLSNFPGAQVTAVCDRNPERVADAPAGVKTYLSAQELFNDPDVDVVILSANNNQHCDLVCQAAQAGKDILCEKPVAMTLEELDRMEAAVKKAGVKFTVHQQRRFDPDFRTTKQVVESGTLGDVYTIKSSLYGYNGNMHDWHIYKSEGGGMLYDWGVHLIDQILWMVDSKVKSVYADVRNVINAEVDDYFHIILRFYNGLTADIELGTYYLSAKPDWFERHWYVGGSKGIMELDGFDPRGQIVRTTRLLTDVGLKRATGSGGPTRSFGIPGPGLIVTEPLPKAHTEHADYFRNYIKAYHGEEPFLVTIDEVRRTLKLMDAVRESAESGFAVAFE